MYYKALSKWRGFKPKLEGKAKERLSFWFWFVMGGGVVYIRVSFRVGHVDRGDS